MSTPPGPPPLGTKAPRGSSPESDIFKLIGYVQDDLRSCQGKLVSLRATLAAMNLPERPTVPCPVCGIDRRTQSLLEEHLANVHDIRPSEAV
jgi:hypothetical protein